MQIVVSEKGEIVLPGTLSEQLGVRPGDRLDAAFEGGRIVLSQKEKPHFEARIIEDPLTGLPVLDFGPGAPILTSEMVAEMLVDFP